MSRPVEELRYAVEEWAADDSRPVEVIARVADFAVAMSAFWAAAAARPKARIVLRQRAREIAHRVPSG